MVCLQGSWAASEDGTVCFEAEHYHVANNDFVAIADIGDGSTDEESL